jgi:hypothetical protein
MKDRPKPMGFWSYPTPGVRTPSAEWMKDMLEAQNEGLEFSDEFHLRKEAGEITVRHIEDSLPGHAAWLDWPWKLHRIERDDGVSFELYSISEDPMERKNLISENESQAQSMKDELEAWQQSVVRSLNGEDYK